MLPVAGKFKGKAWFYSKEKHKTNPQRVRVGFIAIA